MRERIVVIGAGMAGIACARRLADAGLSPLVLDKGRDIGGRMATRRTAEAQFDHGAQYLVARGADFARTLAALRGSGAAAAWEDGSGRPRHVGAPGMSDLPRALAAGLDLRQGVRVSALRRDGRGWRLETDAGLLQADRVAATVPAPQVADLIGADHPLSRRASAARMAPCLTLMAALAPDAPQPFAARRREDDPLASIVLDSSKPGRPRGDAAWVAQADPDWSARHLENDPAAVAARMLPLLCARLGADPGSVRFAAAHRWRHARVTVPLGEAFLRGEDGTLHLGGDWCLGARVEAAWTSGDAMARDILERTRAA